MNKQYSFPKRLSGYIDSQLQKQTVPRKKGTAHSKGDYSMSDCERKTDVYRRYFGVGKSYPTSICEQCPFKTIKIGPI